MKWESVKIYWCTTNPAYPEAKELTYNSKQVCDCTWGAQWTKRVRVTTLTEVLQHPVRKRAPTP